MKHEAIARRRRATNITLPGELVAEARSLGVNISKAAGTGLRLAVAAAAEERWKQDNASWIKAHHKWVEENELPLERYRLF